MSTTAAQGNEEITRIGKVFLAEDGIVHTMLFPDMDITLEDAQEAFAAHLNIRQGKRHPLLVDARKMRSISKEARQYFASDEVSRVSLAFAMIVDTPLSRVLGNFYLGINKPQLPTRLFTSEAEALEWLKCFAAYLKIRQDKRRPILIDARKMKSFARDARQYFSGEEAATLVCAVAMILATPLSRVLGNFYLGLSKPRIPTRLFTAEDEALEWLQGYIE